MKRRYSPEEAGEPRSFRSAAQFRAWLQRNHDSADELYVRCMKRQSSATGIRYDEALDEALCWGWIDGVRHAVDADSFSVRFTRRKAKSRWSAVNVKRATALDEAGRMQPAGLAAFRSRVATAYAYESRAVELDAVSQKAFCANARAWTYFSAQAPWYRRTTTHWVMSAKRPETRARRLATLIEYSASSKPIPQLDRTA